MTLEERFAELRAEERAAVPRFSVVSTSRRLAWRRPAAALVVVLLIAFYSSKRPVPFTANDRAAARAIAAWRPSTDFLLRMPSTGVSR